VKIRDLLERIPYTLVQGGLDAEVTGLCHDNRKLLPGDVFICFRGFRFDSHAIVGDVAAAGAVLIVTEQEVDLSSVPESVTVIRVEDTRRANPLLAAAFYGHPAERLTTVAVTGTKGKTTSTHMMADILRAAGCKTGTIGSSGAVLPDAPETAAIHGAERFHAIPCAETSGYVTYKLSNTTPDAMELQMYLAMMVAAGCTHAVIEVSSQAMKQHRAGGITFDYGIWTNIETGDHIGPNEHKDFDEYMRCKAAMLNQSRIGFVNLDDPYVESFLRYVKLANSSEVKQLYTYGQNPDADYRSSDLQSVYDEASRRPGIRFRVDGLCRREVAVNIPGHFTMYNALAVTCVAHQMGIDSETANRALTHMKIPGRMDIVFDNGHFRVCVDSAHSGYSTRNHLQGLREYHPRRLVCVFGAGGNRAVARRFEMGEASAELADISIVTSEHNRFEPFERISADIVTGIHRAEEALGRSVDYLVIPDRKEAIRYALTHAEEGDVITILGLGSDTYQEENGVKHYHSDAKFVRQTAHELGMDR
jgi:UDP-N-acetylmuramoyl-L-alanyl-D-glutamate--2,6-diaminopimelate ligase